MPPASTMMMAIAEAKIGRWMKNPTIGRRPLASRDRRVGEQCSPRVRSRRSILPPPNLAKYSHVPAETDPEASEARPHLEPASPKVRCATPLSGY